MSITPLVPPFPRSTARRLDSVHEALGVSLATFSHGVVLMDRFMHTEHARVDRLTERLAAMHPLPHDPCVAEEGEEEDHPLVSDEQLQLVAMTCLLIAAKIIEDEPPCELESLRRFVELAGHGRYHWKELRTMEATICGRLRWWLSAPSPLGELRELVLVQHAERAAWNAGSDGSDSESERDDDELPSPTEIQAPNFDASSRRERCAARDAARCALAVKSSSSEHASGEVYSYRRVLRAARALPREARRCAEVGSLCLQACLYSSAGLLDRVPSSVLARAALRAAEDSAPLVNSPPSSPCASISLRISRQRASRPSTGTPSTPFAAKVRRCSQMSEGHITPVLPRRRLASPASGCGSGAADGAEAEAVEAEVEWLAMQMGQLLREQFRGVSVEAGLAQLSEVSDSQRWELPRCLASKKRHARTRPTGASAAAATWCPRVHRSFWPLYAQHDGLGAHLAQAACDAQRTAQPQPQPDVRAATATPLSLCFAFDLLAHETLSSDASSAEEEERDAHPADGAGAAAEVFAQSDAPASPEAFFVLEDVPAPPREPLLQQSPKRAGVLAERALPLPWASSAAHACRQGARVRPQMLTAHAQPLLAKRHLSSPPLGKPLSGSDRSDSISSLVSGASTQPASPMRAARAPKAHRPRRDGGGGEEGSGPRDWWWLPQLQPHKLDAARECEHPSVRASWPTSH
ncbi:hypothetical protein T492DRAFT_958315 [Pavlovales sp. CCMP2436]|nr:hypothetical protein T492DRAFT_958315 [Pavlovales sp. CCMP2436]